MGLLLSILVACVGVVELLAFYYNVKRNLTTVSTQTTLSDLNKRYFEDLVQHRSYLGNAIAIDDDVKKNRIIEYPAEKFEVTSSDPVRPKSRSGTPSSILLNDRDRRSRSPSPRRVTFSKTNGLNHTEQSKFDSRFFKDETLVLLPTECSLAKDESYGSNLTLNEEDVFRRSPSPYPSVVLSAPRNSLCNELVNNPIVSVPEVDESLSRSPTSEKLHTILESKHHSTEFWTNKILVAPPEDLNFPNERSLSSNSFSDSCERFSPEFLLNRNVQNGNDLCENETFDEQFLNSLDGVKKKKLSRSDSLRRSRKKKVVKIPNVSFENESKDDCLSSSSMQNNDAETAKTLTEAANVLKTVNRGATGSEDSTPTTSKSAEPFWVNF